jgi:hypothetical protein
VPAYNQVKVWSIDPTPRPQSRPRTAEARQARADRKPQRFEDRRDRAERNEKLLVWGRLVVVGLLGAAILWWPYTRSCGLGLTLYLAATMMIVVGGLWVVACTWIMRMARTHAVAMLVALWGVALVVMEVLPRVGYAAQTAFWLCR